MVTSKQTVSLFIFLTSKNPDIYINVLGYCLEQYNITEIKILEISEDRGQVERIKASLSRFKEQILVRLNNLQSGKYDYVDNCEKDAENKNKVRDIDIDTQQKQRYLSIYNLLSQKASLDVVIYNELEEWLTSNSTKNLIIDLTGVTKDYLVDIYTILMLKNVGKAYSFKIYKRQSFDDGDLIHNLDLSHREYEYVHLSQSDYTKKTAIIETQTLSAKIRVEETLERLAADYASKSIKLYFLFLIIAMIAVVIIVYKFRGFLNGIEPIITFLTITLPYLLSQVNQISKREFTVSPVSLKKFLYAMRLRHMRKLLAL